MATRIRVLFCSSARCGIRRACRTRAGRRQRHAGRWPYTAARASSNAATSRPRRKIAYRAALLTALDAGSKVLQRGGSSLDAVEAAIRVLEDDPLFNAGRGAVFTADGRNELDASIMDGATRKAGAVAGVTRTRNPISLARAVMEKSRHVMLAREGADQFSVEQGLEQVDPGYFRTEQRWQQLLDWRRDNAKLLDPTHSRGTVGAVAIDVNGHVAAGTSTGGMTGKRWGRIGDSPVDRRGHLRGGWQLRRVGHRFGRILHSRERGAPALRSHRLARRQRAGGGGRHDRRHRRPSAATAA